MSRLRALSERLSTYCAVAAGTCLMAIVVLTTLNIIFRRTSFLPPITGAQEGAAFLGALAVALALPFTQVRKANICVEMLQPYLSERARVLVERANGFISAIVCLLIAWQCAVYALDLWEAEEVSMTLAIPFYPIILVIGACFAMLAVVFVTDALKPVHRAAPQVPA
jgi:TRAP-type C4-dicarboxylate transport system permease small subunit